MVNLEKQHIYNQNNNIGYNGTAWLSINDLRKMFNVGDTKARKMMATLPSVRIGKKQYVLSSALYDYIFENNGISIHWD